MRKEHKFAIIFILLFVALINIKPSWSDSGWDTSYGGDSYSSSDYSSSYSNDNYSSNDYNYNDYNDYSSYNYDDYSGGNSSSSSSSSTPTYRRDNKEAQRRGTIIVILTVVLVIISIVASTYLARLSVKRTLDRAQAKRRSTYNNVSNGYTESYSDMSVDKLQELLPDETLDSLKEMAVSNFIEVQNAWMNFDYDTLKRCCSDELFNTYKQQLEVLGAKNQKNIMNDFQTLKVCIIGVIDSKEMISVQVFLKISFYDYVVDASGNVVNGSNNNKVINNYKLNFTRVKGQGPKFCTSCGAELTDPSSKVCPYCRSMVAAPSSEFVLSKKTNEHTDII